VREARHMRLLAEALDRVSPANNVIHKMYGIYKGSVHLMTNRIYWNLQFDNLSIKLVKRLAPPITPSLLKRGNATCLE